MDNLYSDSLPEYSGEITDHIELLIRTLSSSGIYNGAKLRDKDGRIAIPVTVTVPLPSGGPVDAIDIREKEQLLIVVSKTYYPFFAPAAYSDRKDFPKNKLPHLYASKKNEAPALCLNRNGASEWFSENTVEGFVQAIEEWLFKAGSGLLSTDGNEFDPIRLDSFVGIHAYSYTKLFKIVNEKKSVAPGLNFAILFGCIGLKEEDGLSLKSYETMPLAGLPGLLKLISDVDKLKLSENPILSILCWPEVDQVISDYDTDFPTTLSELEIFCKQMGIDITSAIDFYLKNDLKTRGAIPIILSLKRPKKLVGYDGDIEFLNFTVTGQIKNKKMPTDAPVSVQNHIEPFTSELAGRISNKSNLEKIMFLGGGALGSKIYLHKLRSGHANLTVVDNDKLLHHNLVRHALHSNRLGKNKAEALIQEGKDYFEVEQSKNLKAFSDSILTLTDKGFVGQELIVDTTASLNILNWLTLNKSIKDHELYRGEIVNTGALGILYKEGPERNPRLDDLVNFTYYLALSNPEIASWRSYDAETIRENLPVGLGCSSTTTLISDDDISFHASKFSKLISRDNKFGGYIYLNSIEKQFPHNSNSKLISVGAFDVFTCLNDQRWSIRMSPGVAKKMMQTTQNAKKKEAAGVLIGLANYKTKVIHVFDLLDAPPDSIAECACFYRGIENLPERIDEIKKITGGLVGYIGEWHSHPMGLDGLSGQDKENIEHFKRVNKKVPIPTLSIIVSNGKILPFIFE